MSIGAQRSSMATTPPCSKPEPTTPSNENGDDESQLTQSSANELLAKGLHGFSATRPCEYSNSVGMPLWEKIR